MAVAQQKAEATCFNTSSPVYGNSSYCSVYKTAQLGITKIHQSVGNFSLKNAYHYWYRVSPTFLRCIIMGTIKPKKTAVRKPIDRAYFNTPEFKEKLRTSAKLAAGSGEYQDEVKLWDVTVGDGLKGRAKEA